MGGFSTRLRLACVAFFTILFEGRLPAELQPVVRPEPAAAAQVPDNQSDRAVQMLALLQRDGRLIDFLMEDLSNYSEAQIGAAVRDVHAGGRKVLDRYVALESILQGLEGEPTTVAESIDPATIRLVGNVSGRPPFRGTLLHRGWRASKVELPPLGSAGSRTIIAQAEIEVA